MRVPCAAANGDRAGSEIPTIAVPFHPGCPDLTDATPQRVRGQNGSGTTRARRETSLSFSLGFELRSDSGAYLAAHGSSRVDENGEAPPGRAGGATGAMRTTNLFVSLAFAALTFVALLVGCSPASTERQTAVERNNGTTRAAPHDAATPASESGSVWFIDRAQEAGLHFVHFNGMSGEFYFPEIMPPGVGLLDFDNDGDLDAYLVQGRMLGPGPVSEALFPPPESRPLTGRLYRNDLIVEADGTRTLRFTDVTDEAGIEASGYGMGVASGDVDNDGWVDLYLTNLDSNQLYRNNGDGTFDDISRQSGVDDPAWSVSAAFVDSDRDGWLDLYVGNYVDYDIETDEVCPSVTGRPGYCVPQIYRAQPDRLYRHRGDGRFVDVTPTAFATQTFGSALGVSTADFNGDGWLDIYVANDGEANQLWLNQGDGTFVDTGLLSGTALNKDGKAEGSMGVDAGDFDNDGDEDLFMTHLTGETNTLYVNDGAGLFEDRSEVSGLGPASLSSTGFGAAWSDFDNDGWLDILVVNGRVKKTEERANEVFPYDQRKQLFRNVGGGRFEDVTDRAGGAFELSEVSRGAAFGDIDNDGDVDVLVGNDGGQVRLLMNEIDSGNHWLGLRLVGGEAPRDMVGARVELLHRDGTTRWRRARTDGSYASANDPRVLIGLGDATQVERLRVHWPSGQVEEWTDIVVDRYTTLIEGTGR